MNFYTITIKDLESNYCPAPVHTVEFKSIHSTLKEARKAVRLLIKKHGLKSHNGEVFNCSKNIQLVTNF